MLTVGICEVNTYLGREVVGRTVLDASSITVGRHESNQIVLPDTKVSRQHLRFIRQSDGTYLAEDMDSSNGTWVGDHRISRVALRDGMSLRVGPFTLVVRDVPTPTSAETILPGAQSSGGRREAFAELIVQEGQNEHRVRLTDTPFTIGRGANCDLVLRDAKVSVRHAHIEQRDETWVLVDDNSTNGTFVNGNRVTAVPLAPGTVVELGEVRLKLASPAASPSFISPETELQYGGRQLPSTGRPAEIPIELRTRDAEVSPIVPVTITDVQLSKDIITIGRGADSDLPLPNPQVSRNHARLRRNGATHVIEDLGSTNGTFVNGQRITTRQLTPGDQIQISLFIISYNGVALQQVNTEGNIRLDAIHLNKWVSPTKNLLQDISLSIYPREFVALVGVSGAGKSTLMDALNGFRPAQGSLLINGDDLYANFDAYRPTLGYVPQDDIIHRELSVFRALDYAARLRLPSDTTTKERHARVNEVIEELALTERKDLPITALSGGQRKRVSIGVELLTKPSLFFLDEPTSGLDPGTETRMMHLLRQLADQGRTILLITHATQNVILCDMVIFLAKYGNLAYYGPPREAPEYFGVETFEQIYALLEEETNTPDEWSKRYRESAQYREFVYDRLAQNAESASPAADQGRDGRSHRRVRSGAVVQRPSALRQFGVLVQRNAEILLKNRPSLIIVMMQAILVSTFLVILFRGGLFHVDAARGNALLATTVLFVVTVSGMFIGLSNASKEFVKERHIYRRERAVNLKIAPYLWAKITVLAMLAAIQAVIMMLILSAGSLLPRGDLAPVMQTYPRLYAAYFVTVLIGIMFGLLVSALVNSVDSAVGSIVLVFMPQLMFSGHLLPIGRMRPLGQWISTFVAGRWALDVIGNIAALPRLYDQLIASWQAELAAGTTPPAIAQARIAAIESLQEDFRGGFAQHVWLHWGILGAFLALTALAIYFVLRRQDHA